jgi:hypothetical protein
MVQSGVWSSWSMTGPWLVRDGHGQGGITGGLLAPLFPAGGGVLKVEGGHDLAGGIEDDGMMFLLGPVDAGEVSEGRLGGNHSDFLFGGVGAGVRNFCLRFSP